MKREKAISLLERGVPKRRVAEILNLSYSYVCRIASKLPQCQIKEYRTIFDYSRGGYGFPRGLLSAREVSLLNEKIRSILLKTPSFSLSPQDKWRLKTKYLIAEFEQMLIRILLGDEFCDKLEDFADRKFKELLNLLPAWLEGKVYLSILDPSLRRGRK